MRKPLLILVLVVAAVAGSLSAPKSADARWPWSLSNLCAIRNPPALVTWAGNRMFARIETKCKRPVPILTGVACLERYGSNRPDEETPVTPGPSPNNLVRLNPVKGSPVTQCRTAYAYGDDSLVITVSHVCDFTRYEFFWRVEGWTSVSDPQVRTSYRSPIVHSPLIMATCQ